MPGLFERLRRLFGCASSGDQAGGEAYGVTTESGDAAAVVEPGSDVVRPAKNLQGQVPNSKEEEAMLAWVSGKRDFPSIVSNKHCMLFLFEKMMDAGDHGLARNIKKAGGIRADVIRMTIEGKESDLTDIAVHYGHIPLFLFSLENPVLKAQYEKLDVEAKESLVEKLVQNVKACSMRGHKDREVTLVLDMKTLDDHAELKGDLQMWRGSRKGDEAQNRYTPVASWGGSVEIDTTKIGAASSTGIKNDQQTLRCLLAMMSPDQLKRQDWVELRRFFIEDVVKTSGRSDGKALPDDYGLKSSAVIAGAKRLQTEGRALEALEKLCGLSDCFQEMVCGKLEFKQSIIVQKLAGKLIEVPAAPRQFVAPKNVSVDDAKQEKDAAKQCGVADGQAVAGDVSEAAKSDDVATKDGVVAETLSVPRACKVFEEGVVDGVVVASR